ncbi:MAG TPA: RNA polymerase sigma factor [Opitutaceae bacterium]|jgi:RNA polymerase sigma factor (sigma-70 family)|nr:RNA polymerase sigma factor [Opitutaceae bacterium]
MASDSELLRQYARDRSEPAFAELVHRHLDLVYSAAVRRMGGDAHRAQEISQDVFIALARRASVLAEHPALGAWLYASVRNAALNEVRAQRRRAAREQEAHTMSETESSAPDRAWTQLRPVLDEAMDGLAEPDRRAIILRFFENRSYAELGAALALREEAARMRVTRALEKLRLQLDRRGITSTATALSGILTTHAVSSAPPGLSAAVAGAAAGAPAASALWLKLFGIMTTTKAALAIGGAAILILTGGAVRNTLAASRLKADLGAAQAEYQQASSQLQVLRSKTAAVPAAVPAGAQGSARALANSSEYQEAKANAEALMAAHPEIRKAWGELRLSTTETGVVNLLRGSEVILNPEQQKDLLQAMDGMNNHTNSIMAGGKSYAFVATGSPDNLAVVSALVGGEPVYRDLMRTSDPRNIATDLSAAALAQDAPLNSAQVQQVARILAQNSPDYQQGRSAEVATIDWDAAMAQAQGVLSPVQQAALNAERQQVQFNVALNAAMATQAP